MGLHHFSSEPGIALFDPKPVAVPSQRPPGREWLNGPLVWAIETDWRGMYLFPRDCPRILLRRTATTTPEDAAHWFGESAADMVAYVEDRWLDQIATATLFRYDLPDAGFEDLADAGMWVSRRPVVPTRVERLIDLPGELAEARVELRHVASLTVLRDAWSNSLHASGIRLRNAVGWS
jgi:hypothetical protein